MDQVQKKWTSAIFRFVILLCLSGIVPPVGVPQDYARFCCSIGARGSGFKSV